jgi:hypothetical protein
MLRNVKPELQRSTNDRVLTGFKIHVDA